MIRSAIRRSRTGPTNGPGAGSSPLSRASSRSTRAESANRGTATAVSSRAVRVTSRVLPMRMAALSSRAIRFRERLVSVTSITVVQTPSVCPRPSRSGLAETLRARERGSSRMLPWISPICSSPVTSARCIFRSHTATSGPTRTSVSRRPRRSSSEMPLRRRIVALCDTQRSSVS